MADVQPFAALLYNSQTIKLADVVTEPYDKITPAMQEAYLKRHPNNIVRVHPHQLTAECERATAYALLPCLRRPSFSNQPVPVPSA